MQKMSIDDLMNELDDARLTARANGQASAMVAATMSKAKLLGLDKGVTDADDVQPVSVIVNVKDARKPEQLENLNSPKTLGTQPNIQYSTAHQTRFDDPIYNQMR